MATATAPETIISRGSARVVNFDGVAPFKARYQAHRKTS